MSGPRSGYFRLLLLGTKLMQQPVKISNQFKSSARVSETNFDPFVFLDSFIAHGTVLQVIDNLGAEISGSQQRTFTVTGPYGSGKTTLALYLTCLLSCDSKVRAKALAAMAGRESSAARFSSNFASHL